MGESLIKETNGGMTDRVFFSVIFFIISSLTFAFYSITVGVTIGSISGVIGFESTILGSILFDL